MKSLQVFNNKNFGEVRTIVQENGIWFVGKDVAECLGYKDTSDALKRHVDEEDKGVGVLPTPGGNQSLKIINESGLYSLVLSSKLPSAKKFKRWVTSEVLPSIRKHGKYVTEVKAQQKLVNSFKAEVTTLIDDIVSQKITEIEEKCSDYYRPSSSEKQNISQYIKKRLGISKADEDYELVKQRVLIKLNATK